MDKEQYGYSKGLLRYLQESEETIPKGSFVIVQRKGCGYWYFNKASGKNRLIYLCSVKSRGNEESSFHNSIKILKDKLKKGTTKTNNGKLLKVIDNYIIQLRDEGGSNKRGVERTKKTIQDIISHIRKFREYVISNPVSLKDLEKESFKTYMSKFTSEMIEAGLSKSTIRVTIIHIKQFLDELVEPNVGKRKINYHPITSKFVKSQITVSQRDKIKPNFYTEDKYYNLLNICGKEVRTVWRNHIKGVQNPNHKVVFFTSLLQLIYGFRIGELLTTYLNYDLMKYNHNKKSGYSYLTNTDDDGYILDIYWKRKRGSVNVDFDVYSWVKPIDIVHKEELIKEHHKKVTYLTNIIDVVKKVYSNESKLLPTNPDTLRKWFKRYLIEDYKLTDYGIKQTHDLRDMMINFELHTQKTSFVDLSQMTRNDTSTIEEYYLHTSKELSISKSKKLKTKDRLSEIRKLMTEEE